VVGIETISWALALGLKPTSVRTPMEMLGYIETTCFLPLVPEQICFH